MLICSSNKWPCLRQGLWEAPGSQGKLPQGLRLPCLSGAPITRPPSQLLWGPGLPLDGFGEGQDPPATPEDHGLPAHPEMLGQGMFQAKAATQPYTLRL